MGVKILACPTSSILHTVTLNLYPTRFELVTSRRESSAGPGCFLLHCFFTPDRQTLQSFIGMYFTMVFYKITQFGKNLAKMK